MSAELYRFKIEVFSPSDGKALATIFTNDKPFCFGFSYSVQSRVVLTEFNSYFSVTDDKATVAKQMEIVGEAMPMAKRKFLKDFLGINPFKEN